MSLRSRIVEILGESGVGYTEKSRTILTACPSCGRDDKFSILKDNGACICYRGSCTFGKRWFVDWVVLQFGITEKEAKMKISGNEPGKIESPDIQNGLAVEIPEDPFAIDKTSTEYLLNGMESISFPEFHMVPVEDHDAYEGLSYLENRGISKEMAEKYNIHFSRTTRRVYLPVIMSGEVFGYQGRAIDKVEDQDRIRNNENFRRDTLVMFADNLVGKNYAILAEGPFDGLKFELAGGNISAMGKVVTDKQLAIIKSYGITDLYLALDDDAAEEMNNLVDRASSLFNLYKIDLPQSCTDRCNRAGKKSDFGECTLEEGKYAFDNAKPFGFSNSSLFYEKKGH